MLRKLITSGATAAALLLAVYAVPAAHADFFGCDGKVRPGSPEMGQCSFIEKPTEDNTVNMCLNGNNLEVKNTHVNDFLRQGATKGTCSNTGTNNDDDNNDNDDHDWDWDWDHDNDDDDNDNDNGYHRPGGSSKKPGYLYCMRDSCWVIYYECDDDGKNCHREKHRYDRDEIFGDHDTDDSDDKDDEYDKYMKWYFWYMIMQQYQNHGQHSYYPQQQTCGYGQRNCVYRGIRFGGYQNGYWYY